jgi:hypothetical protein
MAGKEVDCTDGIFQSIGLFDIRLLELRAQGPLQVLKSFKLTLPQKINPELCLTKLLIL